MAYFTRSDLSARLNTFQRTLHERHQYQTKLAAGMNFFSANTKYDIFLSHSYSDKEAVFLILSYLENKSFNVFVDWVENPDTDRAPGDPSIAHMVKQAILNSNCLISLSSDNASRSRWMPWECGFADSKTGKVAVLPLVTRNDTEFQDIGFMKLYPKVKKQYNEMYIGNETLSQWISSSIWS